MIKNKLVLALSMAIATLTGCGGGATDEPVQRNLFAIGETIDAVEDGDPIEGDVSENDQGEGLSYLLTDSTSENGTIVFNSDGTFIYTPNADFSGKDSFTYTVTQASTGETDSAVLTINVISDYETLGEAGWVQVWGDEFNGNELNENLWTGLNTTVADGYLSLGSIDAQDDSSFIKSIDALPHGRFEASIQVPEGSNIFAAFAALPMNDIYDGENGFSAFKVQDGSMIAAANYGIGLTDGVRYNNESVIAASTEFNIYAVEWNEQFIRWYLNGQHIYTVNRLNTWAYQLINDEIITDTYKIGEPAGPFDQEMQLVIELKSTQGDLANLLVDYVHVYTCDETVAEELKQCNAYVDVAIERDATDLIPTIELVTTEIFSEGYFEDDINVSDLTPLTWQNSEEPVELSISTFNNTVVNTIASDSAEGLVIDVSSTGGDANIAISAPGIELVGHNTTLSFDMYIDSAVTTSETFDIRMETGWPYMGMLVWNTEELEKDTWVTYTIPVSDFINSPFIAPNWLTWINGVVEGDSLPLDISNINSILTIEFHDAVHFQLDNIKLSCISSESCVQRPLKMQPESGPARPSTIYQAENYDVAEGADIQLEDSGDEGGGQNVGFIATGDALEYTIVAPTDGRYSIDYRLATDIGSDGFTLSIDGVVVDTQTVEPTGGWQTYVTQSSGDFELTAGTYTARFDFIEGSININWFELFEPAFEIFIEAENYDVANGTDIQLEESGDEGGGQNVGFIATGDSLEYLVNIPADGSYKIEYRLATDIGSDGFIVSFDGVVVDSQSVEPTGGWQTYVTQTANIDLVQGEQTMRLDFVEGSVNINWIRITK